MTTNDAVADDDFQAVRERRQQQRREPIDVLQIRSSVREIFRELGVKTLGDLESFTEVRLLGIRGIGLTTIRSLGAQMNQRGLALAGRVRDD